MKILYIITQADGGGAQKYTLDLAKHFEGAIAAGEESPKLFDEARALGLYTFTLKHLRRAINPWHDFMAVWEIRQLIKSYKPEIVHLNSSKAGVVGSFAAIGLKTKVVFTAHGFIFNEPLPWILKSFYLALEKAASSYRDYIICVSEADRKSAMDYNLTLPDKISTIHNGIDQINFLPRQEARQKLGLPLDKELVVTIANEYKTKGLDIMEKALSSNCLTVIIGNVSDEKKSTDNIKYLGFVKDAQIYLKAFDILAVPSRKEGFPFVVLEAMAAGLPIVATRVGGIPEALGDAGLLVEPENPKALVEAVDKIITDQELADLLSQKALARSKLFTREKMLEETKKVYEKMSRG